VHLLVDRVREFTRADEQGAKLVALGKLAANLAHELNNPASAAQRASGALSENFHSECEAKYRLGHLCRSAAELDAYCAWMKRALDSIDAETDASTAATSLTASDREDEILRWMEARTIPNAWTMAPTLAEAGLPIEMLDALEAAVSAGVLPYAVADFAGVVRNKRAASTIAGSTARIFDIVDAMKGYSYMDQAPIQDVDLAQSLENTLAMLQSRLAEVTVEREYDPDLPAIRAHGGELNQMLTALIENSLDAMNDRGILRLSTKLRGQMIFVEVSDNGPGIDPELRARIFEPFFTTKPPGKGLGLGLDIVQRVVNKHFGSVSFESRPAATCFQVRLPIGRAQVY
jgi:signal transduction histidine kinase